MSFSSKILFLGLVFVVVSAAASVREWKNFENGKVYSHRTSLNSKRREQLEEVTKTPAPEERMLHSHHNKDKKMHRQLRSNRLMKDNDQENSFTKSEFKAKNNERHHRKNVEEEMHLRPLNERHHKFPNPALLNGVNDDKAVSPQISKQKLIKQVKSRNKTNGKRMVKGRRFKRNRSNQMSPITSTAATEPTLFKSQENKTMAKSIKKRNVEEISEISDFNKDSFFPKLPYIW